MGHHDHSGRAALNALVTDLVDTRRRIAALQAHESWVLAQGVDLALEQMAAAGGTLRRATERDMPLREISAEFAAAMRLSDRAVQARMGAAASVITRFPATFDAWRTGLIDAGQVTAVVDAGSPIADDEKRALYEAHALKVAETESPGRLRPAVKTIAARVDPDLEAGRIARAQDARRVRVFDLDDGVARLIADGPAPLVYAIHDRLTRMGRDVLAGQGDEPTEVEDTRTLDQVRADILTDLLLAGAPAAHGQGDGLAAITGHVHVTVPALALLGHDTDPALLLGHGPIDPATARRLTANAPAWTRVLTDPTSGVPLAVDRYRPSKKQKRLLGSRDEHCRAPGCRTPVSRCDIDHTVDAARGGPTAMANLAGLCRRHHVIKHNTAWTVRQLAGGVLEWTSPTGRDYTDRPPSAVRFVMADPATWADAPPGQPPPF